MARDRTPWFLVEVKLSEPSRSCGVNQSSSERRRCFLPGAYSVGFLLSAILLLLNPSSAHRKNSFFLASVSTITGI